MISIVFLLAAGSAAAAPTYPVSARLTLAPQASQHCIRDAAGKTDCSVIEQARAAFAAAVARIFTPGANPGLELVLTVEGAEPFASVSGVQLEVQTRVRILSPGGEVLDEIESLGRAPLSELSVGSVAAGVAVEEAARDFERDLAQSGAVSDWQVGKKIAPGLPGAIRPRGDQLVSLSAGGVVVQGGGDGALAFGPSVRLAMSMRRLFVQAMISSFTSTFGGAASGVVFPASLHTNDLGIEAGAVIRLTPIIELRAGPGLHYLFGDSERDNACCGDTNSSSFSKIAGALVASLSVSFSPFRNGARFVGGLEARGYFFATVGAQPMSRTVPAANSSFGFFFGGELPWGSSGRSAR